MKLRCLFRHATTCTGVSGGYPEPLVTVSWRCGRCGEGLEERFPSAVGEARVIVELQDQDHPVIEKEDTDG